MLWLGLVGAAGMIWIGGTAAVPYVLCVLGIVSTGSIAAIGYAARRGVNVDQQERMTRPRTVLAILLIGVTVAGLVRVAPPSGLRQRCRVGCRGGIGGSLLGLGWKWLREWNKKTTTER